MLNPARDRNASVKARTAVGRGRRACCVTPDLRYEREGAGGSVGANIIIWDEKIKITKYISAGAAPDS